ncbi:MAG: glycoside hydrolase family 2 TIM barrel-domain containing protein [Planctomycetota bacterium]
MLIRSLSVVFALVALLSASAPNFAVADANSMPTIELVGDLEGGFQLLRDGEPFFVQGAGGHTQLDLLAASGGNAIRTWGVGPETRILLDTAHEHGLMVAVGFWLEHARHGFDYGDPEAVAEQKARVRRGVLELKDHPAILMWVIGNEMEGFGDGDDVRIWDHVQDIAAMVKELDPTRPRMTITTEIGGARIAMINERCPDIDIHGINAYGGAVNLPQRFRAAGGVKPYMITEFGPLGTWEVEKTAWGAPIEPTTDQKADHYRSSYEGGVLSEQDGLCLGSFIFLWGDKQEVTATWFGMFLPDGSKTAAVDTMTELWTGSPPIDRAPSLAVLEVEGPTTVEPGAEVNVRLEASDPEGQPLRVVWRFKAEAQEYLIGGDAEPVVPEFPEVVAQSDKQGATLSMPEEEGSYRIFTFVYDPGGHAAVANVPLRVEVASASAEGPRGAAAELPLMLYSDKANGMPFAPSGYMGDTDAIRMNERSREQPHQGATALEVTFVPTAGGPGWGGVAWQHPAEDWGDLADGHDLTGAKTLSFWARGDRGGERVMFGYGLLGSDKTHADTGRAEQEFVLTSDWQRYTLPVADQNLARIKTGFYWTLASALPVRFFLDDITYE